MPMAWAFRTTLRRLAHLFPLIFLVNCKFIHMLFTLSVTVLEIADFLSGRQCRLLKKPLIFVVIGYRG